MEDVAREPKPEDISKDVQYSLELVEEIRGEMNFISTALKEVVELTEKVSRATQLPAGLSAASNTERPHLIGLSGEGAH